MSLLVRKIARAKWPDKDYDNFDIKRLQADAISVDLKTKGNTLSVWEVENEDHINDAVLALVTSAERIETIHVIYFDADSLRDCFNIVKDTDTGMTPIERLKEMHRNICELDYEALGEFSKEILYALKRNNMKTITASNIKKLVKDIIETGELEINKINPKLQENIKSIFKFQ